MDLNPETMTFREFEAILDRYVRDQATEDERRLAEAWFDSMEVEVEDLAPEAQTEMRERLWANLNQGEAQVSFWKKYRAIAASLILLAASAFLINRYYIQPAGSESALTSTNDPLRFHNEGTGPQQIDLADGTVITLQPGGAIVVPHPFDDKREVELSGEAFFNVAHDPRRPFLVYARGVTTKVLGTSFNIKAPEQGREVIVSVRTGRVSVLTPLPAAGSQLMKEVILNPNQQVVYDLNEQQVEKKLVDHPHMVADHAALPSSYENEPVIRILNELEKTYGVDIQYDAARLSHCTLTSDMSEEGLYERIDIVCNAIGARYQIGDTTIRVDAPGCK